MSSQHESMYIYDSLECVTYRVPASEVVHTGQGPFFKVCEAYFANVCANTNCGYAHVNILLIERLKSRSHEFHEACCGLWKDMDKSFLVHVPPLAEPIFVTKDNVAFTRGAVQAYLACRAGNVCSDHLCTWCPIGQMCQNVHVDKTWLKKTFAGNHELIMDATNNSLVMEYSNSMVPRFATKANPGAQPAVMEILLFPRLQLSAEVTWEVPSPTHAIIMNTSPLPSFPHSTPPHMTPSSTGNGEVGGNGGDSRESENTTEMQANDTDYRRYRIFVSGKGIPDSTDAELIALLGPLGRQVMAIDRPVRSDRFDRREFLYLSMADGESFEEILSWQRGTCTLDGQPLNFAEARPKPNGRVRDEHQRDFVSGPEPTTHSYQHGRHYHAHDARHSHHHGSFFSRSFTYPNREGSGWRQGREGPHVPREREGFQNSYQDSPNWSA